MTGTQPNPSLHPTADALLIRALRFAGLVRPLVALLLLARKCECPRTPFSTPIESHSSEIRVRGKGGLGTTQQDPAKRLGPGTRQKDRPTPKVLLLEVPFQHVRTNLYPKCFSGAKEQAPPWAHPAQYCLCAGGLGLRHRQTLSSESARVCACA